MNATQSGKSRTRPPRVSTRMADAALTVRVLDVVEVRSELVAELAVQCAAVAVELTHCGSWKTQYCP